MRKHTCFTLALLFSISQVSAQSSEETDSVSLRFLEQLTLFPQEKIYVHTDKSNYAAGDTLWLRAHLVDAATHIPSPVSRYVYVELANNTDSIVNRIKIKVNDSIYRGQIPLDHLLSQGYYTLRAYTGFMKNLPEDYIFKSTISITNAFKEKPQSNTASEKLQKKTKIAPPVDTPPFDVQFFPEGGYLPANTPWRVAFKAIREDGWNEFISGEIKDKATGEVVATLPTPYLGMGYVTFIPQEGKQYVAECFNAGNGFMEFELPPVTPNAQVLTTTWRKSTLMVALSKPVTTPLRLVMQTRGIVFYSEPWKPSQKVLTFDSRLLPAGVIQVLLLDDKEQPVSERLVFNKHLEDMQLSFATNKTEFEPRELVKAEVSLTDGNGQPLKGDFSVSVTDDESTNTNNTTSILSYLLLTSELKGTIEFPEAYFDASRKKADYDLDVLMMTQGWRRYDSSKILRKEYERPSFMLERCQEITGKVISESSSKPRINSPISLLALEHLFSDETLSDSTGHFRFTRFEFPENTGYVVRGTTKKGSDSNVLLSLDKESFYSFSPSKSIADLYNREYITREYEVDTLSNSDLRTIQLDEVVIKARQMKKAGKSIYHSFTGRVFSSEDLMYPRPSTLADLLARLPGVLVSGGTVTLRGTKPLILLDDVEFDNQQIMDLPPDDVDEIELMKDASAAIFGSRGAGGAILITTKSGDINRSLKLLNVASVRPLGYQIPAEFYLPKYSPDANSNFRTQDKRTTLFWSPRVSLSDAGKANFEFYTANNRTSYTLIMQGVTTDGRIIYKKEQINKP